VFYCRPICRALKFRKDPFRGVDGIDSKSKTDGRRHIGGGQIIVMPAMGMRIGGNGNRDIGKNKNKNVLDWEWVGMRMIP